jgi:hypothetical protein
MLLFYHVIGYEDAFLQGYKFVAGLDQRKMRKSVCKQRIELICRKSRIARAPGSGLEYIRSILADDAALS